MFQFVNDSLVNRDLDFDDSLLSGMCREKTRIPQITGKDNYVIQNRIGKMLGSLASLGMCREKTRIARIAGKDNFFYSKSNWENVGIL